MDITFQCLLELLRPNISDYSGNKNPIVNGIEIYNPDAEKYCSDVVYIATLSQALSYCGEISLQFICVYPYADHVYFSSQNIVAIKTDVSDIVVLYFQVQSLYNSLQRWFIDMQESVIRGDGVQALLDMSETYIKNAITIMDYSYRLLAHTKTNLPDDDVNVELIKNGFHSDLTLQKFKKYDRFKEDNRSDAIIVSDDRYISRYVTVKKSFKQFGYVVMYVVMICTSGEPSQGVIDLFTLLTSQIRVYATSDLTYGGEHSAFESAIYDLIDKNTTGEKDIQYLSEKSGLPLEGFFDLYKIKLEDADNQPYAYLALNIRRAIPELRVGIYHKNLIVLSMYKTRENAYIKSANNLERIIQAIGNKINIIAVSNIFISLKQFKIAYLQADEAMAIWESCSDTKPDENSKIIYFEDYYIRSISNHIINMPNMLYANSKAALFVTELTKMSEERKYDYVKFLYVYLTYERRPTQVSKVLHIHRNTVIYHITNIESTFGVSFDDPLFRNKVMLELMKYCI